MLFAQTISMIDLFRVV